jgi:hypothetical protein
LVGSKSVGINVYNNFIFRTKIAKTTNIEDALNILPELEDFRMGKVVINM